MDSANFWQSFQSPVFGHIKKQIDNSDKGECDDPPGSRYSSKISHNYGLNLDRLILLSNRCICIDEKF